MREYIKTDLKETGHEDEEWIHLVQDRVNWQSLVKTVMTLQTPYKAEDF
jgi:hypothetical protein